ncbi:MAG: protein kinase [Planctomycetes bacterium]|nr:protein kinase [Planctomycetota bacterium]
MGAPVYQLVIRSGKDEGRIYELPAEGVVAIGSAPSCQLQLTDPGVLKVHCYLKCSSGKALLAVRDPEAAVSVNGAALQPVQQRLLKSGDALHLGDRGLGDSVELLYQEEIVADAAPGAGGSQGGGQESGQDPLVGRQVGGYLIEELLGKGAMGTVYKARQLTLDRPVAIKILSPELTNDREFIVKFLREARAAAKLNHPNVVQIYDAAQEEERFYFSMEYLAGGTLADLLRREGPLAVETALKLARDAMKALIYAEGQKIVHRDIKPDNLLLADDGTVKIADLGIAIEHSRSKAEAENKWVGSPRYMAPEQALGVPVDSRADLYALGSTLYRALSGKHPFDGKTAVEILKAKSTTDPIPLEKLVPGIHKAAADLVKKMMARDPGQRFSSCTEALKAVENALASLKGGSRAGAPGIHAAEGSKASAGPKVARAPLDRPAAGRPSSSSMPMVAAGVLLSAVVVAAAAFWALKTPPAAAPLVATAPKSSPLPAVASRAPDTARPAEKIPEPAGVKIINPNFAGAPNDASKDNASSSSTASPPPAGAAEDSKELGEIKQQWFAGLLDSRKAINALEAFKKSHPESAHVEEVDRTLAVIREKLAAANRAKIDKALSEEIEPLLKQGRTQEAGTLLDNLLADYPENKEDIAKFTARIDEASSRVWAEAEKEADRLAAAGDFAAARKPVEDAAGRLRGKLRETAEKKLAELKGGEDLFKEQQPVFAEKKAAIRAAIAALDFKGAGALCEQLPAANESSQAALAQRLLARQREQIAAEVKLCEDGWKSLAAGISQSINDKSAVPLAFQEDPIGTQGTYRLKELSGAQVTLQGANQGKAEKRNLFSALGQYLVILAAKGRGEGSDVSPAALEGTGLLLLYTRGPFQGRELLLDSRLGKQKTQIYAAQLKLEEETYLAQALADAKKRMEQLQKQALEKGDKGKKTAEEWKAVADDLLQVIAAARRSPTFDPFRDEYRKSFLIARREALRVLVPDALFHGKVKSFNKADGKIQLLYAFASEDELADFTPVKKAGNSRGEISGRLLKLRGEFRFLKGDVFTNRLAVSGAVPASGYNPAAPNINVALWTRDNDALSKIQLSAGGSDGGNDDAEGSKKTPQKNTDPDEGDGVPNDYFVFGIGYKTTVFNSRFYRLNYLNVPGLNTVVPMPANALFGGVRGKPLHSLVDQECMWGVGVVGRVKGQQSFTVRWAPEGVTWTINNRPVPIRESKDAHRLKSSNPFAGSISFFTHGEVVQFASLLIEGDLNPAWVEERLDALAAEDLAKVGEK